jgi:hypothetical protein
VKQLLAEIEADCGVSLDIEEVDAV